MPASTDLLIDMMSMDHDDIDPITIPSGVAITIDDLHANPGANDKE